MRNDIKFSWQPDRSSRRCGTTSGVLAVKLASKCYRAASKSIEAVRSVNLTVGSKETVGLVGESGCGKSTLARLIARLENLDSGQIILCGEDITHKTGPSLRRAYTDLKMIFQDPRSSFDPRLTLGASILETLKAAGVPKSERRAQAIKLLGEVGLSETFFAAKPSDVSGGECQRAAIARAIAAKPKLLICDEATSALDVSVQAQIMELLCHLRREHDMSVLFISHDLALVSGFCDRTYVMKDGKMVESGDTGQILNHPRHEYTRTLIKSIL
ncbi:MAG: ABC transporter ATP-binding protein [Clostridia bacterium]|nr:ABC transporter ATP-binding protein [Clostridia bacterium]NCC75852.1 ABC transporter ATP-binding protein [Clostridia bacterium]